MVGSGRRERARRTGALAVTLGVLVLLVVAAQAPVVAMPSDSRLVRTKTPFGISMSRWTALWWDWAYAPPVHDPPFVGPISNPLFDTTGEACGVGQGGPVWFLAGLNTGGSVTRSCSMPVGKDVLIPLINVEGDNIGVIPPLSPHRIRVLVRQAVDTTTELHLRIDGTSVPIAALFADRVASPMFAFALPPEDNAVQGFEDGKGFTFPVVSDGYWVMLKPLSLGDHVIRFGGTIGGSFSLDVTYDLRVIAPPPSSTGAKTAARSMHSAIG